MDNAGVAIYYGIVAWLACWLVDLLIEVTISPFVVIVPLIKIVILIICLTFILLGGYRQKWLW